MKERREVAVVVQRSCTVYRCDSCGKESIDETGDPHDEIGAPVGWFVLNAMEGGFLTRGHSWVVCGDPACVRRLPALAGLTLASA